MRKWEIGSIVFAIVSVLFFIELSPGLFPYVTNYRFNTVFASSPYSDKKLKKVKFDISMSEVIELIGEPLNRRTIKFLHCMLFTKGGNSLDPTSAKFHGVGGSDKEPYIALWFSEENKVNYVFNSNYTEMTDDELVGLNIESVLDIFGKPKETLLIPKSFVWSYTTIIDGPYTGDFRGIYTRRVYFNTSNKVIAVELGRGSTTDIYSGIYKKGLTMPYS